ncbi:MAG: HesA/MoeB/ThiF family protein [Lachnospiraceae bacterium]|jgi:molybdopterin/thiamine biosynthesis adenylyltransferase|nr:HesA/MoeB/ThiF family protein [Lachnospiraceae bacterium]MDE6896478.1 HesA/MoeB/ThiF family protein [Lachnospiraceae bacterium]
MKARYERNLNALSKEEQESLSGKRVCIAGCGGLGGYLLEYFLRIGIGHITVIDGDCFEESNLNRQLLSDESSIGSSKIQTAKARAAAVNSQITVTAVDSFLTEDNSEELLKGHDLVLDAVDSLAARRLIGRQCAKLGIPFVYGAIQGWYAQISLIMPGSSMLDLLCGHGTEPVEKSALSFTPAACAAFQASEAVKYLCGREDVLNGRILYVDLLHMETEILCVEL